LFAACARFWTSEKCKALKKTRKTKALIGDRVRSIREQKNPSRGDIEKSTGLLRWYISRVEDSHTIPSVDTIEKFGGALELPTHQPFYIGGAPPEFPTLPIRKTGPETAWGSSAKDVRYLAKFGGVLTKTMEGDWELLLSMAQKKTAQKAAWSRRLALRRFGSGSCFDD
jgi:hypothetical protein